jgi:predicted MFS family arabinose efflux permease
MFAVRIGTATLCRLLLNTARRFAYPFAPVLSRGMDVPLVAVTSAIAANQGTSVVALWIGPIADRLGYRRVMLAGLVMLSLGMLAAAVLPLYGVVLAALVLAGLGKSAFDPAIQAYVSERVSFRRRGLAIGIIETAWAGSTLVGIPLIAVLIDRMGWRAPFLALGIFGVVGAAAIWWLIPPDSPGERSPSSTRDNVFRSLAVLWKDRAARGVLAYALLTSLGNDGLFVVYGAWLEDAFAVNVLVLGAITGGIGLAELAGEVLVATLSDRIGLKRSVIIGVTLCSLAYIALPVFGLSLSAAIAGLLVIFLIFEFMVVSSISLSTELLPTLRATMMAALFATAGVGRIIGALLGGPIWLAGGITAVSLASAAFSAIGLAALLWGLRGWRPRTRD